MNDDSALTWIGSILDHRGFAKAVEERWEPTSSLDQTHCKLHDTLFNETDSEQAEPCWPCYEEFERKEG